MPPVGEVCVPIPIDLSSGHDYSSLEVVWPEHGTGGRLCYCPPYEGEHQLFSRCTSTVSCNTSHSISISNNSVCFAHLRQGLDKVSVFFTLLDYCYNYRCAVQSIVASFNIFVMSGTKSYLLRHAF